MTTLRTIYRYTATKVNEYGMLALAAFIVTLMPQISGAVGGGFSAGAGVSFSFGTGGGGTGGIGEALCTIVDWFTAGSVGSAVASLAVIFLGIGAFFGKVTWGMAVMFAAGIFAIFGSAEIVEAITGGAGAGCF